MIFLNIENLLEDLAKAKSIWAILFIFFLIFFYKIYERTVKLKISQEANTIQGVENNIKHPQHSSKSDKLENAIEYCTELITIGEIESAIEHMLKSLKNITEKPPVVKSAYKVYPTGIGKGY